MEGLKPPWEGQYKLRPTDKEKLTAADVMGPDGIVYPNWTRCGVQGGIPQVKEFATLERYGGKANDGLDDSVALGRACEEAGKAGGGAVVIVQDLRARIHRASRRRGSCPVPVPRRKRPPRA